MVLQEALTDATGILGAVEKRLSPIYDPNCQKYIDDPDRRWYGASWKTNAQVARHRALSRDYKRANPEKTREYHREWVRANPDKKAALNARRIQVGGMYLGSLGFSEREVKEMIGGKTD